MISLVYESLGQDNRSGFSCEEDHTKSIGIYVPEKQWPDKF